MATIKRFEDIEAWQKARVLSIEVYKITVETDLSKDFRFRDQVNSAAGSVMDNIAEGFERGSKLELINFITIAKGSCAEVKSQLYRIKDRGFINEERFEEVFKISEEIGSMLGGWIKYLNQTEIKGPKFKDRL